MIHQIDRNKFRFIAKFEQVLVLTPENAFSLKFQFQANWKKSGTRDFWNSSPFERLACFYLVITGNFEHFQYFNFKINFLKNAYLYQNTWVPCANHPNVRIHSFQKRWSLIWGCFFPVNTLKNLAKLTGKYLCHSLFFNKETLAQVFSCEFCEIIKNTFLMEPLWRTASEKRAMQTRFFFVKAANLML